MALLEVTDLQVSFGADAAHKAVDGVSFSLDSGQRLGLIGESGSGKSLTCLAIQGLQPTTAVVSGSIKFAGAEIAAADDSQLRRLRGDQIAAIFQEPMTALNPVLPIWRQLVTANVHHQKVSRQQAKQRAIELAALVDLPQPATIIDRYPHELSGGQRQRVVIAMAVSAEPKLILADEPTTALDGSVAARTLELIAQLCDEMGSALLLVTHDMAVAASSCERLLVMQRGKIVEAGPSNQLLTAPKTPYAQALLAAARNTSLDLAAARAALADQRQLANQQVTTGQEVRQ